MSGPGDLVIFGVSNVLSDMFDAATALGYRVTRIVTNRPPVVRERTRTLEERIALLPEPPVVESLEAFVPAPGERYFVGVTSPAKSALIGTLTSTHGIRFATLVHPSAYVSPFSELGEGVFVGAGSVVAPGARIEPHVFVNRGVTVGHDTRVEEYARLFAGCDVGGHARIGRGATIGLGAAVIEELVVGAGAYVAAGGVVLRDVEPGTLVAGVPAVFKKRLDPA